jgi:hypothetical protein
MGLWVGVGLTMAVYKSLLENQPDRARRIGTFPGRARRVTGVNAGGPW